MRSTVMLYDETIAGARSLACALDVRTAHISVRDLIRERVYEEVQEYHCSATDCYRGLVEPTQVERMLNGSTLHWRRQIDWKVQYHRALTAFERNAFFIIVGERQVTSLDEEIDLAHDTTISFIKLVPLAGG